MGFDPVSYIIGHRAGAAAADPLKSWSQLQLWLRAGQLGQVLEAGDRLNVEVGGTVRDFDVLGLDEDVPVGAGLSHVLSLQSHDVLEKLPFDPQQYLFAVTAEACTAFGWPDSGMPAGTYHVVLDHGAYDGGTGQDGSFQFTTTQVVPVGGGVRHSTIGASQSGGYAKSQITGGTFMTYAADTVTGIETGLVCTEGSNGTCLGTTSSKMTYLDGDYINYSVRQMCGGNRWSTSYLRQYLNSSDAQLQWTPGTIWSRDAGVTVEGFLHSLDPALRAVLCPVRTRYSLCELDAGGYEDVVDCVKLLTRLDLTGSNASGMQEGPVDADGVLARSSAYSMWQELTSAADRVKYYGDTADRWWIVTRNPATEFLSYRVTDAGAVSTTYPGPTTFTTGIAPCLFIG